MFGYLPVHIIYDARNSLHQKMLVYNYIIEGKIIMAVFVLSYWDVLFAASITCEAYLGQLSNPTVLATNRKPYIENPMLMPRLTLVPKVKVKPNICQL